MLQMLWKPVWGIKKVKQRFTLQTNTSPWHMTKGLDILPHRYLCSRVCCCPIHNIQEMEATSCPSTGEWIMKNVLHTQWRSTKLEGNKIMVFPGEWMELVSELTQTQGKKTKQNTVCSCSSQLQILRCEYITWSDHRRQKSEKGSWHVEGRFWRGEWGVTIQIQVL